MIDIIYDRSTFIRGQNDSFTWSYKPGPYTISKFYHCVAMLC